jgi:hypothetical protein
MMQREEELPAYGSKITLEGREYKENYSNVQVPVPAVVDKEDLWTRCGGNGVLEGVSGTCRMGKVGDLWGGGRGKSQIPQNTKAASLRR